MLRGVTREIAKLPQSDQPGAYKEMNYKWDSRTTEHLQNIYKFVNPSREEIGSLFDRYP